MLEEQACKKYKESFIATKKNPGECEELRHGSQTRRSPTTRPSGSRKRSASAQKWTKRLERPRCGEVLRLDRTIRGEELHSCMLSAMDSQTERTTNISSSWQNDSIILPFVPADLQLLGIILPKE